MHTCVMFFVHVFVVAFVAVFFFSLFFHGNPLLLLFCARKSIPSNKSFVTFKPKGKM